MFYLGAGGDKLRLADQVPQPLVVEIYSQMLNHLIDAVLRRGAVVMSISQPHAETDQREFGVPAEKRERLEVCDHGGVTETRHIPCHEGSRLSQGQRDKESRTFGSSKSRIFYCPLNARGSFWLMRWAIV